MFGRCPAMLEVYVPGKPQVVPVKNSARESLCLISQELSIHTLNLQNNQEGSFYTSRKFCHFSSATSPQHQCF